MMSRLLRSVTLVGVALMLSAGAAAAERRVALIIGNSAYKSVVPLPNPARDAAAVAAMFKKAGFEVVESVGIELFGLPNTVMVYGDARKTLNAVVSELSA